VNKCAITCLKARPAMLSTRLLKQNFVDRMKKSPSIPLCKRGEGGGILLMKRG